MRNLFENLKGSVQNTWGVLAESLSSGRDTQQPRRNANRKSLVKDRPVSLEDRYSLIDDDRQVLASFNRLKRQVYAAIQIVAEVEPELGTIFKEAGKIGDGRPYFFVQFSGQAGFLFEASSKGWIVSRAEKIVQQDLFLRHGDVLDQVSLYTSQDRRGFPRITSVKLGESLLSMTVYEQELLHDIGLGTVSGMLSSRRIASS